MKKSLTIAMAGAALAAAVSLIAGASKGQTVTETDALSAYEIVASVRAMGLNPIGEPTRRGPYYVLHAYDPSGVEVRVVVDVQFGDILSVAPARAVELSYAPRYERGPRIIHVPQADEQRASINERDEPGVTNENDDVQEAVPAKPRRVTPTPRTDIVPKPKPQRRSDAPPPPPPGPPRTVLSAPPPAAEGPTPIRSTPRFKYEADSSDKFSPPDDPATVPQPAQPDSDPQQAQPDSHPQ